MTLTEKIINKINELKSKITLKTQTEYTTLTEAIDDLLQNSGGGSSSCEAIIIYEGGCGVSGNMETLGE